MLNEAAPKSGASSGAKGSTTASTALPQQAIQQGLEAQDSTALLLPLTNMRDNFLHKSPLNSGKLIVSQGRSRFVDNNLWTSVSDEFAQAKDAIDDWTDDSESDEFGDESGDIVLGLTPTSGSGIAHLHPSPENIYKLWGIFLENINPMTKIIHRPSLEKQLIKACQDLENIPRGLECLMFAIYTCAIGSMTEDDCEKAFGETRRSLFTRYRTGCRRALAKAKFLGTGDLMVCQSFVLYLVSYFQRRWALPPRLLTRSSSSCAKISMRVQSGLCPALPIVWLKGSAFIVMAHNLAYQCSRQNFGGGYGGN
jgi:hypothetical protein